MAPESEEEIEKGRNQGGRKEMSKRRHGEEDSGLQSHWAADRGVAVHPKLKLNSTENTRPKLKPLNFVMCLQGGRWKLGCGI